MLSEAITGEVRVSFHYINDNWTPGDDVALLALFVEEGEGTDNVGAETGKC